MHIYDCFDPGTLLDAAYRNLRAEADRRGEADSFDAMLVLTESVGYDRFGSLSTRSREGRAEVGSGWRASPVAGDACALRVRHADGRELLLIAGCQIDTEERVEIQALGTRERPPDGEPAARALARVADRGAVPVLPWGVGKWLGRRGALVRDLVRTHPDVLIADQAGRPHLWPRGRLFAEAETRGRPILSGSDPLRVPGEERMTGRAGFVVDGSVSSTRPTEWLTETLMRPGATIETFGGREGLFRFLRNQLLVRVGGPQRG